MLIMFVVPVWLLSVEQFNLLSFRYFHSFTNIYSFIYARYFHLIFVQCTTHIIQLIKYKLDLLSLIFRVEILCTLHYRLSRAFFTLCCVVWCGAVVFTGVICFLDSLTLHSSSILNRQYKWHCSLLGDVGEVEYTVVTSC